MLDTKLFAYILNIVMTGQKVVLKTKYLFRKTLIFSSLNAIEKDGNFFSYLSVILSNRNIVIVFFLYFSFIATHIEFL